MSDDLPEGWAKARLADAFALNPAKPSADEFPGLTSVSFVPMGAVDSELGAITAAENRAFAEVRKGYTSFHDGDVIMAKITPCFENGKMAVARDLLSGLGFGSTEFHVFRSRGAVEPRYLFHFLRQQKFRDHAAEFMTGTAGQARVPIEYMKGVELPVPPIAEQGRIVAKVEELLAEVNCAKARLTKVQTILKRFHQSVLAAACSGELTREWRERHPDVRHAFQPRMQDQAARRGRRGANLSHEGALLIDDEMHDLPTTWTYARADQLVEPGTVVTYGIVLPGPEVSGGVPYVRGQDVEDGWLRTDALRHTTKEIASKHQRSTLRHGDVLLCIIRNLRVAIVPEGLDGANITQGMVRMRPDPAVIRREFLAAYLASPQAQEWMKRRYFGMDMPRINVEDARAIPVALPPLQEQVEIVRLLQQARQALARVETKVGSALGAADALPQAILSKAFSGELVQTEAELARLEGRAYEPASVLLERVKAAAAHAPTNAIKRSAKRQRRLPA